MNYKSGDTVYLAGDDVYCREILIVKQYSCQCRTYVNGYASYESDVPIVYLDKHMSYDEFKQKYPEMLI